MSLPPLNCSVDSISLFDFDLFILNSSKKSSVPILVTKGVLINTGESGWSFVSLRDSVFISELVSPQAPDYSSVYVSLMQTLFMDDLTDDSIGSVSPYSL